MLIDLSKARIFLRPGTTDLRKAVNGLSMIVQETIKQDPFSGSVFLFCNREKKLLKAVYWGQDRILVKPETFREEPFSVAM